jgi:hypothetical protein
MDAGVVGEFGVEGGGHGPSLPDGYGSFVGALGGENFDALADVDNLGSTDEDHFQRGITEPALADGTIDLASVGVAADADVEGSQAFLLGIFNLCGEEDCPGAGPERGLGVDELFQLFESGVAKKFQEGARFAAWDDEPVEAVQLFGFLDEHNFGAQLLEPEAVSVEIALQGQDTDFHNKKLKHNGKTLTTGEAVEHGGDLRL